MKQFVKRFTAMTVLLLALAPVLLDAQTVQNPTLIAFGPSPDCIRALA
jgi:hypothetical protein